MFATTVGVYLTLPVGPAAWGAFQGVAGALSNYAAVAGMLVVAVCVVCNQREQVRRLRASGWIAIGGAMTVWAAGVTSNNLTPAEKTHFLTYGLLAWVVLLALDLESSSRWRYGSAAVIVGVLGWLDEGIQYLLPSRYFEWKDVWLNVVSGVAVLVVIAALRGEFRTPGEQA